MIYQANSTKRQLINYANIRPNRPKVKGKNAKDKEGAFIMIKVSSTTI